ncbi:uncharacterized protein LOC141914684 [Tubulanus polymorphus]|uniref:uncharacterized protein LOC141914684 n=1 Tax=Tubulanus polymorphus TaxID=672921 RepID=UPI003DA2782F
MISQAIFASVFLVAACLTAGMGDAGYDSDLYGDDNILLQNQYQWLKNQGYFDYNDAMASDSEGDDDDDDVVPAYSIYDDDTDVDRGDWDGERDDDSDSDEDFDSAQHADRDDMIEKETQLRSNDPRDPEKLQQSSLWGTHYVSGGAGEGKQHLKPNGEEDNKQEVKSDASLPAYCEPPNPCPKGYNEDKNCVKGVEDTAEYNRKYILDQQESGVCACDSEHMKHCPENQPKIDTKQDANADLKALLEGENLGNPYVKGNKRDTLTAKKRPAKRFKRFVHDLDDENNPFLAGEKLDIAAKKSPPNLPFDKWEHLDRMQADD